MLDVVGALHILVGAPHLTAIGGAVGMQKAIHFRPAIAVASLFSEPRFYRSLRVVPVIYFNCSFAVTFAGYQDVVGGGEFLWHFVLLVLGRIAPC